MGKVKAVGRLRHMFHGTYSAAIALSFKDSQSANDALATLGGTWRKSPIQPSALIWQGKREALECVKEQLKTKRISPCKYPHCDDQCKYAEIDSIKHSIDFGPEFEVEIECVCSEQAAFF